MSLSNSAATAAAAGTPERVARKKALRRGAIQTAVVLIVLVVAFEMFSARYKIGIAAANGPKCLEERVFLIDTKAMPSRDDFIAFRTENLEPWFKKEVPVVKMLRAVPGDHVEVADDVRVNSVVRGQLTPIVMEKLGKKPSEFRRDEVVPDGKYWVMGTLPRSLDSRYWGYINRDQIIGKAYAIW